MRRTLFIIVLLTFSLTATKTSQAQSLSLGYEQVVPTNTLDFDLGIGARLVALTESDGITIATVWNRNGERNTFQVDLAFIPMLFETERGLFYPEVGMGVNIGEGHARNDQGYIVGLIGLGMQLGKVNLHANYQQPIALDNAGAVAIGVGFNVL